MSKLIIANWKMNGSIEQIERDLSIYAKSIYTNNSSVVLALPNVYLYIASQIKNKLGAKFSLAAQDVSEFTNYGAYTGEVSATMLKGLGTKYLIIGHSERRASLNETDDSLINKIDNTLNEKITPIFCIGESKGSRENIKYIDFLQNQLAILLKVNSSFDKLVIAYEPIWAIGTGVLPTSEQISEVLKLIKAFVQNYLPHAKIMALYGGSVSGINASEILNLPEVDGVLVGGASLKPDDFISICTY